ncbi:MAG: histidinol dehydrogenase, partial [Candidatus Gracilibacteria bacterium]|nr:histidinol dehydrogenase [Candidatus Gracilibacteria bacterium]
FSKVLDSNENLIKRGVEYYGKVLEIVKDIEKNILETGDEYSKILTEKFDGVKIDNFKVTEEEFEEAEKKVSDELKKAIKIAKNNIETFHKRQIPKDLEPEETYEGVLCYKQFRAIEKVGLYILGGTAPLFSTVLMLVIPAKLAKCKKIVL